MQDGEEWSDSSLIVGHNMSYRRVKRRENLQK